jgi:hypothetical protein
MVETMKLIGCLLLAFATGLFGIALPAESAAVIEAETRPSLEVCYTTHPPSRPALRTSAAPVVARGVCAPLPAPATPPDGARWGAEHRTTPSPDEAARRLSPRSPPRA